jgi:hypothetical protein
MPIGIRWIAKQLANHAKNYYSNPKEYQKLIGSWIFLHYITPAIISPETYGVAPGVTMTENHRRTLLMVGM